VSRLRLVLAGAGWWGGTWMTALRDNPDVDLVGIVDLDPAVAAATAGERGVEAEIGTSVTGMARRTAADAVVNVTVPAAHHAVSTEAMRAGLPVLCEKPLTPTVAAALSLAATAEVTGQLHMTSQSRRYRAALTAFRDEVRGLGELGSATTEYFAGPRFGGFRDRMQHALLEDMAIHTFDTARFLFDREPVAVYCEEYNPGWSWYAGGAAATAVVEFAGGLRYTYSGSWCADGMPTSWNGAWRVVAAGGTATWDGDGAPLVHRAGSEPVAVPVAAGGPQDIGGALAEFVDALRTGTVPSGEVHANVLSLAMVEAAIRSAAAGERLTIARVLEDAYAEALRTEVDPEVRDRLASWGGAAARLL
jgi:predicted dehydrogenase